MDTNKITSTIRRLLRTRCRKVLGRGDLIFSYRNPDKLLPDGTIEEGAKIEIFGSITCARRRWHLGEHSSPKMKPCVSVECPPLVDYRLGYDLSKENKP